MPSLQPPSHGGEPAETEHAALVPVELAIIVPTFNEAGNVALLVEAVGKVLGPLSWEMIFVDDDSLDGTAARVFALNRTHPNIRCIRRLGRRGLSSAVVEGCLATAAPLIAVMDADFQHDEALLPRMVAEFQAGRCDIVVGSRYVEGGGIGDWSANRQRMSRLAGRLSRLIIDTELSDPMSGFFMIRREAFEASLRSLSRQGYKILLDILASAPKPLAVTELPYRFRERQRGESKVDSMILIEYGMLLTDKLFGGLVPPRFIFFALTGGVGVGVHLLVLGMANRVYGLGFLTASQLAVITAMIFNYCVNNLVTYRDVRRRGWRFWTGMAGFCVICSAGAVANIGVASMLFELHTNWALAGFLGALMGAVFNFAMATNFVWRQQTPRSRPALSLRRIFRTVTEAGRRPVDPPMAD
jgi:dolichol-phosphate mannosyltransferase